MSGLKPGPISEAKATALRSKAIALGAKATALRSKAIALGAKATALRSKS
jgi:hypothetical protein